MTPDDLAGCVGLALLIVLIIASLPWPTYDEQDFTSPQERRAASRRALARERMRQATQH